MKASRLLFCLVFSFPAAARAACDNASFQTWRSGCVAGKGDNPNGKVSDACRDSLIALSRSCDEWERAKGKVTDANAANVPETVRRQMSIYHINPAADRSTPGSVDLPPAVERVGGAAGAMGSTLGDVAGALLDRSGDGNPPHPVVQLPPKTPAEQKAREQAAAASGDAGQMNQVSVDYLKTGQTEDAARVASQVLASHPKDSAALTVRSLARLEQGRYGESSADATAALAVDPSNASAQRAKAYADSKLRPIASRSVGHLDFGTAREAENSVASAASPSVAGAAAAATPAGSPTPASAGRVAAGIFIQSALTAFKVGDLSKALSEATRALQADPKNAAALALRSKIFNKMKNYKAAVEDAEAALAVDPQNAAALLERGYAKLQLGDLSGALADIDAALALDPGSGTGHLYRAYVLEKAGKFYEAAEEAQKAFWLDAALKPLADDLLARVGGGKGPAGSEFGPENQRGTRVRTFGFLLALTLAILFFAGRFISFERDPH